MSKLGRKLIAAASNADVSLSSATTGLCDCCGLLKRIKMYVLQSGTTAWICKPCAKGETK